MTLSGTWTDIFFIWRLCLIWPWMASIVRSTIFYILLRKWLSYHLIFLFYILIQRALLDYSLKEILLHTTHHSCGFEEENINNKWVIVFLEFSHRVQLLWTNFQLLGINILPAIKSTRSAAFPKCLQLFSLGFSSMLPTPILSVSMLVFFYCTGR